MLLCIIKQIDDVSLPRCGYISNESEIVSCPFLKGIACNDRRETIRKKFIVLFEKYKP